MHGAPTWGLVREHWWKKRTWKQVGWALRPISSVEMVEWSSVWQLRSEEMDALQEKAKEDALRDQD